jgi:hypothetical protein
VHLHPSPAIPAKPRARLAATVAALALVLALAAWVASAYWGYSYDDAFITYRYAASWAARGALEYNPGESVLGTTAPGYALLLGLLARLTGVPVAGLGTLLSVGSLVAVSLLLHRLAAGASAGYRLALPLLFALLALPCQWNVEMLGAESFLVLALGLGGAVLALATPPGGTRQGLAGLLLAAATACRLDAAALAGLVGLALWLRERRFPRAFALAGLAPLALWLGWLWSTYGRIVPVTLAAKHSELAASGQLSYTAAEWQWLRRTLPAPAAVALLLLAAAGAVALARSRRALPGAALVGAVTGAWLLVHELVYRAVQVPFAPWYHVALLQATLAAAAGGALALAHYVSRKVLAHPVSRKALAHRLSPLAPRALLAVALAAALLLPALLPWSRWTLAHAGRPPDPRYPSYRRIADALAGASPAHTVAAVEIGVLGYFAPARVLDLAGLVTPEVVPARASGTLPALVAARAPEYILDADAFPDVMRPVLAAPGIAGRYTPVISVRHGEDPHRRLRLLRRVP